MALIALNWDRKFIRIAVASAARSGSQLQFDRAMSFELDSDAEELSPIVLGEKLKAILSSVGVTKGEATVIVSRGDIEMRQFDLPPVPDEELPDMVRFQARSQFTNLTDECLVDYVPLDKLGDKSTVLAASFSEENAAKIRATIDATGLRLKHIVVRHFAACELIRSKLASEKSRVVVEIIGREADISVVKNDYVLLARTVRVPETYTDEQFDAWLPSEIRRTMASAQGQAGASKAEEIIVCGSAAEHEKLSQDLQASFEIPARFIQPLEVIRTSSRFEAPAHQDGFASLMGSLVQTTHKDTHAIDFLNPRQKPKAATDTRKLAWIGGTLAAMLLLGAVVVWSMFSTKNGEIASLKEQVQLKTNFLDTTQAAVKRAQKIDDWKKMQFNWLEEMHGLANRMPGPDKLRLEQFMGSQNLQINLSGGGAVRESGGEITLKFWKTDDYELDELEQGFMDFGYKPKLDNELKKSNGEFDREVSYQLGMPAEQFDLRGTRLLRPSGEKSETVEEASN